MIRNSELSLGYGLSWSQGFKRNGMTLVELMVVIGIIGLVASISIPAVMQAQESSRRVRCANNLRQIGLGLQSYHASHSVFPNPCGAPSHSRADVEKRTQPPLFSKQYSLFTQLLAQIDQVPLFNAINFSHGCQDPYLSHSSTRIVSHQANWSVMSTSLDIFLCPSDSNSGDPGWTGNCNYRASLGSERWYVSIDGPLEQRRRNISAAATTDGLSNTAALTEKLRGRRNGARLNPRTDMILGGRGLPYSTDESYYHCKRNNTSNGYHSISGLTWFVGTLSQTCYNHIIEPNSSVPDCALPATDPVSGLFGARSNHPGGVHVIMADGSMRFVSSSISRQVWRAMGTRAGGEIVSGP